MEVAFLSRLSCTELVDCNWSLNDPFYYLVKEGDNVYEIIVPQDFVTDFCSVPRIPFAYLLFGNVGNRAGLLHDALYSDWNQILVRGLVNQLPLMYDREWADAVLEAALKTCGISWAARHAMWLGVRSWGWNYFKQKSKYNLNNAVNSDSLVSPSR